MIERLDAIMDKYNTLQEELTHEDVLNDFNKTKDISKKISDMEEVVSVYKKYKNLLGQIADVREMLGDSELSEMAREELPGLESEKEKLEKELEILLVPKDPNDDKNVIMEIRGAAGGDEANIFAGDLFRMYTRYAEKQGYTCQVYNAVEGTAGGFSQIEFIIKGQNIYSKYLFKT